MRTHAALLALALAVPGVASAQEQEVEQGPEAQRNSQLINMSQSNPMQVEDALAQNPGAQFGFSATNADISGDDGLLVEPQIQWGAKVPLELGASWATGIVEGEADRGQVRGWVLGQLTKERGALPTLALKAQLLSPHEGEGVAGQFGALATRTFGKNRVHANASYRVVSEAPDHTLLGLGADRQLSDRVLLVGDAYVDLRPDAADSSGVEVGGNVLLDENTALQAVVGYNRHGADDDPRVLLSITRQL